MSEARPRALVVDPGFSSEAAYIRLLRRHFDVIPALTSYEGLAELDVRDDRTGDFDVIVSRRHHMPEVMQALKSEFNGLFVTAGTLVNADRQAAREAMDWESPGRTAVLRLQLEKLMPSRAQPSYGF